MYQYLEIYPTDYCQLSCSGCELHANKKSLSREQLSKIAESKILSKISKEISILGGEPTTWEYICDFLKMCRFYNRKANIVVTTNGIDIEPEFIQTCVYNNIKVNVSWHDNIDVISNILLLKRNKILNNIIIVPSTRNYTKIDKLYNTLSSLSKCVCRPFIGGENIKNLVKLLNKSLLENKNSLAIESNSRFVNRKPYNNIELINKSLENKNYYKAYECKCGNNAVIYTDGNLYHCLSQAISGQEPLSMKEQKEITWIPCKYNICCCDTFELRSKS